MPPKKPWETRTNPQTANNISEIIQSNPTIKEQIVKQDPSMSSPISPSVNPQNTSATNSPINSTDPTNAYGNSSLGGAYGSSYGGYGSSYGGYGSSYGSSYGGYGGYGGYGMGSSYGMGYGGMGYGRYGMMGGGENQNGFLMNSLMTLQSFGYLINILCQIARSLNTNCQGLYIFYESFKNLAEKIKNGVIGCFTWMGQKIKKLFNFLLNLLTNTLFFWRRRDQTQKFQAISIVLKCLVVIFAISLYPIVRKGFNSIKA